MSTITLRAIKGTPLTFDEMDNNFNNLNTDKLEAGSIATLTNKSINLATNTLTGTVAEFNTALSDGNFATQAGVETLTNKSVNLSSNTLTGTVAQFNTALSDGDFATLAGSETLTNKTLTSPAIDIGVFTEAAAPGTPASGKVALYAKTDGLLYIKDDAGVESSFVTPDATDALKGKVELATSAEVITGTDTERVPSVASLRAGALVSGTATTASGTAVTFTGIPSWVKRVTVSLVDVSPSGSDQFRFRIGSGGVSSSGYSAAGIRLTTVGNGQQSATDGVPFPVNGAAQVVSGQIVVTKVTTNVYAIAGTLSESGGQVYCGAGSITLAGAMDRVSLALSGTDNFDGGTINILYE